MYNGLEDCDLSDDGTFEVIPTSHDMYSANLTPVKIIIRDEQTIETSHIKTHGFVKTMAKVGNSNKLQNGIIPDNQLQQTQSQTITQIQTQILENGELKIDGVEFFVTKDQKQDGSDIVLKIQLTNSTEHNGEIVSFLLKAIPTTDSQNKKEIYFSEFKGNEIILPQEEGVKLQQKIAEYHQHFPNIKPEIAAASMQ